ncbi:MAG: hypothetical protein K6A63_06210 [Acholeplasmatales bacterium]|nr:hypothetical protein [Acholeplasmatales bacterium]
MYLRFKEDIYKDIYTFILTEYKNKDKIKSDTILIYPGLGNDILYFSKAAHELNLKAILVSYDDIDPKITEEIYKNGHELVRTPKILGLESLIDMASDMKLEIEDGLLINPFKEKLGVSYFYKALKDILKDYLDYDNVIIGLGYGYLTGVAKYLKSKNDDVVITGVKEYEYESSIIDEDYFDNITDDINLINDDTNDSLIIVI